jgi:integrase
VKVDLAHEKPDRTFSILNLVLENGERLPCLVDAKTWIPTRVATRWAVRYRRYHVQSSTLADNLRILQRIYIWAEMEGQFDLDDFLTSGRLLNARQIESLVHYFRTKGQTVIAGVITPKNVDQQSAAILGANAFNHHLSLAEDFFTWSLDGANRGGLSDFNLEQLAAERAALSRAFQSYRIESRPSERMDPLDEHELASIRRAIAPRQTEQGSWEFPQNIFSPRTRLRNWLMLETCLALGLRRGELLKLRLDCLPRGHDDGVRILRLPDDPLDSRAKEPSVKTAERLIPAARSLLIAFRAYLTTPPPLGRASGKSPYLFVSQSGAPVSLDSADDIIAKVGRHSGVVPLSWHRLRHTWAERLAEKLRDQPNGVDLLMYLGGWTNPQSPKRYIQHAIAKQAIETMRAHQEKLYPSGENDPIIPF